MAESMPTEVKEVKERRSHMQGTVRRHITAINKLIQSNEERRRSEMSDLMDKLVQSRDAFSKIHLELVGMYEEQGLDDRDLLDSARTVIDESLTAFADADRWMKDDRDEMEREIDEIAQELSFRGGEPAAGGERARDRATAEAIAKMQSQLDELHDSKRQLSELQTRLVYNQRMHDQEAEDLRRTIVELRSRESLASQPPLSSTIRDSEGHGRPSLGAQDISAIGQIISQSNVSIFKQMLDQSSMVQREIMEKTSATQRSICTSLKTAGVGLTKFKGSPLDYTSFMRRYDDYMGNTDAEASVKLNTLVEYCEPSVVEELECCFYKDADEGYSMARRLLKRKYGNPFLIAQAWVERLLSTQQLKSAASLAAFARSLRNCQETLSSLGYLSEIECTNTMRILVSRLPSYLQNKWRKLHREETEGGKKAGLMRLIELVQAAADEQSDPVYGTESLSKLVNSYGGGAIKPKLESAGKRKPSGGVFVQESQGDKPAGASAPAATKKRAPKCWCCAGPHYTSVCPDFNRMSPAEKLALVREKELCFLCMSANHKLEACFMRWRCQREGCGEKHHSALHDSFAKEKKGSSGAVNAMQEEELSQESDDDDDSTDGEGAVNGVVSTLMGEYALPLTPVIAKTERGEFRTHVLLDSGSSVTLCTTRLFEKLGIKPHDRRHLWLGSLGGVVEVDADMINMRLCKLGTDAVQLARNVSVVDKLPVSDRHVAKAQQIGRWSHLRDLDMPTVTTSGVDMIIGQDNAHLLRHEVEVSGGLEFGPFAVMTPLGWTVYGLQCNTDASQGNVCTTSLVDPLECQVERFWVQEEIPAKRVLSAVDRDVVDRWNREMQLIDGHICLPIPYKREPPGLPRNFNTAKKRLDSLGKRLMRDPVLRRDYVAGVLKNIEEGYAEWVTEEAREGYENYIPHHAVVTLKKSCRIVSDASSELRGVSLNNSVHQGPLNTNMLVDVLVKFREGRYTLTGDIKSMFNQVLVPPEHRDSLRFLWWANNQPGGDVIVGRMTTHTFGGGWCPSVASHALHMCADLHSEQFEKWIAEVVRRNFYVDDLLKSLHTIARAIQLARDLPRMLAMNRFHLTKLGSNVAEVLLHIPVEERAAAYDLMDLDLDEGAVDHALGCILYPKRDLFGFKVGNTDRPLTRRGMLSVASSLFDPLGLLSPYVLIAKLLIQVLCQRGLDWDEPLPGEVQQQWLRWLEELQFLSEFTVPRWLGEETEEAGRSYMLNVFVDASSRAYGAVVYFCVCTEDRVTQAMLLTAKTRVAPLKTLSIPRLELNAALLGVRLEERMREYLTCRLEESKFWSDSMVVLRYLKGQPRDYKVFVANRVAKILGRTDEGQWQHVPTELNPADYVSRGLTVSELTKKDDWIGGPAFLREGSDWAGHRTIAVDDVDEDLVNLEIKRVKPVFSVQEVKKEAVYDETTKESMRVLLTSVSSWRKLVRLVLWLLRCKRKLRGDARALTRTITVAERRDAEHEILRWAQRLYITKEQRGCPAFKKLFPFMEEGLYRVGGRLMLAQLRYEEKFPIFLPQGHVADIYVQCVHEIVGHCGVERTYQEVRTRYWLIGGKKMIRRCMFCQKQKKRLAEQLMAPLPAYRITEGSAAFETVGVDYMGPVSIRIGRSNVKRYICVFSDMVIRAMHVEVAADLTSSAFLNAFQRFTARRGCPKKLISDNGTNFVGAEKDVRIKFDAWDHKRINERLGERGISWEFNTPRASHHGGAWERMIRSFRNLFMAQAGLQVLTDDTLSTFACAAEQIYNSRPLTRVGSDPGELLPITPAHLLNLRPMISLEGQFTDADMLKKGWKQVQGMAKQFWSRWSGNYLKELQRRYKWQKEMRDFQVGDIVLVHQDAGTRLQWPLGRVMETYKGRDGHVRSVRVRMREGEFNRPIAKLVHLECEFPEKKM